MADAFIDVSDIAKFAKVLRAVEPVYERELNAAFRDAGELIATKARVNASFSRRIPKSLKTRRRGLNVTIQAGGPGVGHAAPLENRGEGGTFRHPVFGNREVWVEQAAQPFLSPALESAGHQALALVENAVDSALRGLSVV